MLGALLATQSAPSSGPSRPFQPRFDAVLGQWWTEDALPRVMRPSVPTSGPAAVVFVPALSQPIAVELAALPDDPAPQRQLRAILPGWSVDRPPRLSAQVLCEIVAINQAPEPDARPPARTVLPGWSVDQPPRTSSSTLAEIVALHQPLDAQPPAPARAPLPGWSVNAPPPRSTSTLGVVRDAWSQPDALPALSGKVVPATPTPTGPPLRRPDVGTALSWWVDADPALPPTSKTAAILPPPVVSRVLRAPRSLAVESLWWAEPDAPLLRTSKVAAWLPIIQGGGGGHDWRTPYALFLAKREIAAREAALIRRATEDEEALTIFLALEDDED